MMLAALALATVAAAAPDLSLGWYGQSGFRPGLRTELQWALAEGDGRAAHHALVGGADAGAWMVPNSLAMGFVGATGGWVRTGEQGLRSELVLGFGAARLRSLVPVYTLEADGMTGAAELEPVSLPGHWRRVASARVGIGWGPTETRRWGVMVRPTLQVVSAWNGGVALPFAVELAAVRRGG